VIFKRDKPPMPPPLCSPVRHPIRWTKQKIEAVIDAAVLAHIGTLIVVALYYLVLGATWTPLKQPWHQLIPDDSLRHMVRGVSEGLLGGSLGQLVVFNPYKHIKAKKKKLNLLDKIEIKLRIPNLKDPRPLRGWQFMLSPLYIILYAIPGFFIAYFALKGFHTHFNSASPVAHNYGDKVKAIWTSEKDQKIVGLFASIFLGRRPLKKIANDIQGWFAQRRVVKDKKIRIYHTPQFEARYNSVKSDGVNTAVKQSGWVAGLLAASIPVAILLAAYGWYVLTVIA
jgi:hypothetical protein